MLLGDGSECRRVKLTISGIHNPLNFCVIFHSIYIYIYTYIYIYIHYLEAWQREADRTTSVSYFYQHVKWVTVTKVQGVLKIRPVEMATRYGA
jgi:hypothetical protein